MAELRGNRSLEESTELRINRTNLLELGTALPVEPVLADSKSPSVNELREGKAV